MTFDSYWSAVVAKYPHLEDPEAKRVVASKHIKALLRQAHERGREMQVNIQRYEKTTVEKATFGDPLDELFRGFGRN